MSLLGAMTTEFFAGGRMTLGAVLLGLEIVWVAVLSGQILLEKRAPMSTLVWILVLFFLPVLGILAFFLVGPRRLERKKLLVSRARASLAQSIDAWKQIPSSELSTLGQLSKLATGLGSLPPEGAARLTLFADGDTCYDAMVEDIARATRHVHAEYYIFRDDPTGHRIRDALIERARAGVRVRLLIDALGSGGALARRFLRPLREAGTQIEFFNPPFFRLGRRIFNFRTHRKILVVDGQVGFTGGMNVCDDHSARAHGKRAWRDTHLRIEGSATHGLQRTFLENWSFASGEAVRLDKERADDFFPQGDGAGCPIQIIASGPDLELRAIAAFYFAAITSATERVWITTPYFVPDEALVVALVSAALRGVDVQLLLPAATDARLADAAGATFHDFLMQSGVRIFIYGPEMIHAKTCVIDRELSIVGTANLDARSLRLNFEVIAAAYDAGLNAQLAGLYERDRTRCRERKTTDARLPLFKRLFQAAARLLAPQL